MKELWLPVPDVRFSDFYLISSEGRVKALDRVITEVTGLKRFHKGRTLTPKKSGLYLGVSLFSKPHLKRFYLHRLVAEAFIPNPLGKPHVNHINFDRHDNRACNLEWTTPAENTHHSYAAGRLASPSPVKGELQHSAKLTADIVQDLRFTWIPGSSITALAQKYGVTNHALYQVLRGRTWKHVAPSVAINWTGKS